MDPLRRTCVVGISSCSGVRRRIPTGARGAWPYGDGLPDRSSRAEREPAQSPAELRDVHNRPFARNASLELLPDEQLAANHSSRVEASVKRFRRASHAGLPVVRRVGRGLLALLFMRLFTRLDFCASEVELCIDFLRRRCSCKRSKMQNRRSKDLIKQIIFMPRLASGHEPPKIYAQIKKCRSFSARRVWRPIVDGAGDTRRRFRGRSRGRIAALAGRRALCG